MNPGPRAVARAGNPQTSWDAARSISAAKIRRGWSDVLRILGECGPLIDEEAAGAAAVRGIVISRSGLSTRRHELVTMGQVVHNGEYRFTKSGRRAQVWALVSDPSVTDAMQKVAQIKARRHELETERKQQAKQTKQTKQTKTETRAATAGKD